MLLPHTFLVNNRTHLDPEHFYLEVVDHLRPVGRSDILRLCGRADVNGDLEVILLLADEGLISGRVDEAFVSVDVVGRRRPGGGKTLLFESELTEPCAAAWCKDGEISWSVQHFGFRERYLKNYFFCSSWFCTHSVW